MAKSITVVIPKQQNVERKQYIANARQRSPRRHLDAGAVWPGEDGLFRATVARITEDARRKFRETEPPYDPRSLAGMVRPGSVASLVGPNEYHRADEIDWDYFLLWGDTLSLLANATNLSHKSVLNTVLLTCNPNNREAVRWAAIAYAVNAETHTLKAAKDASDERESRWKKTEEARLSALREARESDSRLPVGSSQQKRMINLFDVHRRDGVQVKNIPARVHADLLQERRIESTVHISSTRRALQRAGLIAKPKARKK